VFKPDLACHIEKELDNLGSENDVQVSYTTCQHDAGILISRGLMLNLIKQWDFEGEGMPFYLKSREGQRIFGKFLQVMFGEAFLEKELQSDRSKLMLLSAILSSIFKACHSCEDSRDFLRVFIKECILSKLFEFFTSSSEEELIIRSF